MSNVPPPAADPYGLPPPPVGVPVARRLRLQLPPGNRRTYLIVGLAIGFLFVLGLGWFGTRCVLQGGCFAENTGPGPVPTGVAGICFDVNGTPVACTTPVTLEVAGRLISVQAEPPDPQGRWQYFASSPDHASWIQGTVVNYVLGLATSEENDALFINMPPTATFTLTLENDTQLIYRFASFSQPKEDSAIFQQQQPALTLVLLGKSGKAVITGAWVATIGHQNGTAVLRRTIGTPVPVDSATVTVLGATYLRDPALGLPEGNGYFLVDFTVVYSATSETDTLDTQQFELTLVDANGQSYQPTGSAASSGRYPEPIGQLQGGEALTATVGYLVDNLPGNVVSWRVRLRPADTQVVTFDLPFSARPTGEDARAQAVVNVTAVEVSPDRSSVTLTGSVSNPSGETLVIEAADLVLSTGLTQSPMTASDPVLPWQVPAGGQLPFRATFLKPPTQTVIFSVLGRSFAVQNIP